MEQSIRENKDSYIFGNSQKGNQSTFQKFAYLDILKIAG